MSSDHLESIAAFNKMHVDADAMEDRVLCCLCGETFVPAQPADYAVITAHQVRVPADPIEIAAAQAVVDEKKAARSEVYNRAMEALLKEAGSEDVLAAWVEEWDTTGLIGAIKPERYADIGALLDPLRTASRELSHAHSYLAHLHQGIVIKPGLGLHGVPMEIPLAICPDCHPERIKAAVLHDWDTVDHLGLPLPKN